MKNIFDTIFGQKIFVTISFINLSPIIIVRSGLTSGKAKRMESNIEARGLPSIVGANVLMQQQVMLRLYLQLQIQHENSIKIKSKSNKPGKIAGSLWGVVTSSFVAKKRTFGRLRYVAALTILR